MGISLRKVEVREIVAKRCAKNSFNNLLANKANENDGEMILSLNIIPTTLPPKWYPRSSSVGTRRLFKDRFRMDCIKILLFDLYTLGFLVHPTIGAFSGLKNNSGVKSP